MHKFREKSKQRSNTGKKKKRKQTEHKDAIFTLPAAAAAKSLLLCPTLYDPIDQAPPSLGFSRQEHWSGLPFPSPMHESEK